MSNGNETPPKSDTRNVNLPRWRFSSPACADRGRVRTSYCSSIHAGLAAPPEPGSDGSEYDSYAWNISQGRGFSGISPDVKTLDGQLLEHPTAYRAPATSVFLGGPVPVLWTSIQCCTHFRVCSGRVDYPAYLRNRA